MIITEETYLEHHGVKGMKWGQRKAQAANAAKATGRVAWTGAKATGRGAKKVALWSKDHPKEAALIAIGTYGTAKMLQGKIGNSRMSLIRGTGGSTPAKGFKVTNKGMRFINSRSSKAMGMKIPRSKGKVSALLGAGKIKKHAQSQLPDLKTPFLAKDASGNVVGRIGSKVSRRTIRSLN